MKDFNACDDFLMTVLTSHITAAVMKYMQIESLAEVPSENVLPHANNMWSLSKDDRRAIIEEIGLKIVNAYVDFIVIQVNRSLSVWIVSVIVLKQF